MSALCHRFALLRLYWCLSLAELILTNGLEGHLKHLQFLLVENICVIDGAYLQDESALPT